jgi:cytosine/adenosine deaminase-related metal-dependent hydrolase
MNADIIIKNGVLIPVDPERRILHDGAVAILKDRIVAVGPTDEVTQAYEAGTVIDASGKAILPGLIDGHAHAGHGLMKNIGADRSDLWAQACEDTYTIGSTEDFWYVEARLTALERLRFGITTGVSLLGGGDSVMRTDEPSYGDAHCEGVLSVGTRSVVTVGTTRPPHPRTYKRWEGSRSTASEVGYDQQRETCRVLAERWHDTRDGHIFISMLTPTLRLQHQRAMSADVFDEAVRQTKDLHALSREHGLVFMQDGHTQGSVALAHSFGVLGPQTLLSHSVDLTEEEIRICAETGTRIVHNPSAIAAVLGRCPVPELIEAGVLVCIGSDGTSPDRSTDMFRHMQQCMHYHRTHFRDPSWMPAGKVLEMCTIDAARALGIDKEVGSLEAGKKADVILVDLRRPHLYPAVMPEYRVTCFANGNDVDTVIIGGKVLLQGRKALHVDEDAILDAAQAEFEKVVERLGLDEHMRTSKTFWGHVRSEPQPELWQARGWRPSV